MQDLTANPQTVARKLSDNSAVQYSKSEMGFHSSGSVSRRIHVQVDDLSKHKEEVKQLLEDSGYSASEGSKTDRGHRIIIGET